MCERVCACACGVCVCRSDQCKMHKNAFLNSAFVLFSVKTQVFLKMKCFFTQRSN